MKAIILAAGKGERLRSVTSSIPKPMIVYDGRPVLEHNVELCRQYGANDIYINLHHLPHVIMDRLGDGSKLGVHITYSFEETLLGTAGAVKKIVRECWSGADWRSEPILIVYGDTYSYYNIGLLLEKFRETHATAIIGFHYRDETQHSGVAEFSEKGKILRFIEKPKPGVSSSHWVNVGIYILKPEIIDQIPDGFSDFAKDIFPALIAKGIDLYGVCDDKDVKVFDTIEMYNHSLGL